MPDAFDIGAERLLRDSESEKRPRRRGARRAGPLLQEVRAKQGRVTPRQVNESVDRLRQPSTDLPPEAQFRRLPGQLSKQFRDRFQELEAEGIPRPQAFMQAVKEQQQFVGPLHEGEREITPAETFGSNALDLFGFSDEAAGALDAVAGAVSPAGTGDDSPSRRESLDNALRRRQGAAVGSVAGALINPALAVPGAVEGFFRAGERPPSTGSVLEDYRRTRDVFREQQEEGRGRNPKAAIAGKVAEGVAGGAAIGGPAGIAQSVPRAVGFGVAEGSVMALGESDADLTRGDTVTRAAEGARDEGLRAAAMSANPVMAAPGAMVGFTKGLLETGEGKDLLTDVAIGGGLGAAGALGGEVISKVGAAALKKLPWFDVRLGARSVAKDVSGELAEPQAVAIRQTVGDFTEHSDALEKWAAGRLKEATGEDLVPFSLAQKTGAPSAAMAESAARQFPRTANEAQSMLAKQMRQTSTVLEDSVNRIAANPESLTKANVGQQVADEIENYVKALSATERKTTAPMYAKAFEETGEVIPVEGFLEAANELFEEAQKRGSTPSQKLLAKELAEEVGDLQSGRLSPEEVNNFLKKWGKGARGSESVFLEVDRAAAKRPSRMLFSALQDDLAKAAADGVEAAQVLKTARDTTRVMKEEIDNVGIDAIKRILKIEGKGASDQITEKLLSRGASPQQVENVFEILEKASPEAARNARAQLLEDLFTKGKTGKIRRGAKTVKETGSKTMDPAAVFSNMQEADDTILAAFKGDPAALSEWKNTFKLMQRLARTKARGLEGAQTGNLVASFNEMGENFAARATGETGRRAWKMLGGVLSDDKARAKALSSEEGLRRVGSMLRKILNNEADLSDKAAGAFITTMTNLGVSEVVGRGTPGSRAGEAVGEAGAEVARAARQRAGQLGGVR